MTERLVKALAGEVPGERRDRPRESLRRFIARPACRKFGHRPRLQEVEPAIREGPLQVLWEGIESLDVNAERGQLRDLLVVQRRPRGLLPGQRHPLGPVPPPHDRVCLLGDVPIDHHTARLLHHELIHITLTRHNQLTQTERRIDDHLTPRAGDRVDGKGDACHLAGHHALDDDGHGRTLLREPTLVSVAHGTVLPERDEAATRRLQCLLQTRDVEIRLVLTGEGGAGQIFQRRRRANSHGAPSQ